MKRLLTPLLIVCNLTLLSAQENTTPSSTFNTEAAIAANRPVTGKAPARKAFTSKKSYFRFGERVIALSKFSTLEEQPYVLLALHNNEQTASAIARKFIQEQGGTYLELFNNYQRNIEFTLFNRELTIDPNNIFTPKGRWAELAANQKKDHIISQQIGEFAKFIIEEIPFSKAIISLHNNAEGDNTINLYLRGGEQSANAKMVYQNPEQNINDFVITTDKDVFEKLKDRKINVVLQHYQAKDDGSLSIYCARVKRTYIGIETQTGHAYEQEKIMLAVTEALK